MIYVKIKESNDWYRFLSKKDNDLDDLTKLMRKKIERNLLGGLHGRSNFDVTKPLDFILKKSISLLDYKDALNSMDRILLRESGSYMPFNPDYDIITDVCYSPYFPIENVNEVVVCENDENTSPKFIKFLEKNYGKVTVVNYFDLRTNEEVKEYLKNAKYITFITSFDNYEWFVKAVENVDFEKQKMLGYSRNKSKWENALKICDKVEVIKTLK